MDLNSVAKILKNIEKSYDKGEKLLDESSSKLEDSGVRFCVLKEGKKIADKNWVLTAYDELSADSGSPAVTNQDKAGSVTANSVGKNTKISEYSEKKNDFPQKAVRIRERNVLVRR